MNCHWISLLPIIKKHSYLSCDADVGVSTMHSSSNSDWAKSLVRETYLRHAFTALWTSPYTQDYVIAIKSAYPIIQLYAL